MLNIETTWCPAKLLQSIKRLVGVRFHEDSAKVNVVAERMHLVFTGVLLPDVFIEFARHRAGRLALGLEIADISSVRISLTVSGAADLIDAFEMACSLGPYDCMVHDVVRDVPA